MDILCPISEAQINEKNVRVVAVIILLLALVGIFTDFHLIFLFLSIDFFIRGFLSRYVAPTVMFSQWVSKVMHLKPIWSNAGPKFFAAKIGFVLSLVVSILYLLGLNLSGNIVAYVLCLCAALEGFLGFCLGCYGYTLLLKMRKMSQ